MLLRHLDIPDEIYYKMVEYVETDDTKEIIARHGFDLAMTTKVGIADLTTHDSYVLPRIDTNDLPRSGDAEIVSLTRKLM